MKVGQSFKYRVYLLISHHLHVGAVHKFNMMQMEINRAVAKFLELTK